MFNSMIKESIIDRCYVWYIRINVIVVKYVIKMITKLFAKWVIKKMTLWTFLKRWKVNLLEFKMIINFCSYGS